MLGRRAGGRGGQSSWHRGAMGGTSCKGGEQEAEGGSPHGAGRPGEVPHGEKSGRWRHRLSCCEGGGWQTTGRRRKGGG